MAKPVLDDDRTICINLFVRVPHDHLEAYIRHLIAEAEKGIGGIPVKYFRTMDMSTKFSRYQLMTGDALESVVAECLSGSEARWIPPSTPLPAPVPEGLSEQVSDLGFYNRRGSADSGSERCAEMLASVCPLITTDMCSLTILGPARYDQQNLLELVRGIAAEYDITYGCMLARDIFAIAHSLVVFLPSFVGPSLKEWAPLNVLRDELGHYQRYNRELDRWIPRAYWGNIISEKHIECLGGEEKIRKRSGCCKVERWGSNLFLQLTEDIWKVSIKDLKRLDEFLAPARFPDAPRINYV